MDRGIFNEVHEIFRGSFRQFVVKEIVPFHETWEECGQVDKAMFREAGDHGFLCIAAPEEYGGGGQPDFRYSVIITEELQRAGVIGSGNCITLHNDVALPYFLHSTTEEQRRRWLPGMVTGRLMAAISMSEPGTGSDLARIQTTAIRDGDDYVVNGSKTFVTNGINSDIVITAVKTEPSLGHRGMSLLVIEEGTLGFQRGRKLNKIGLKSQDTAELFFQDARVPSGNLLGEPGSGFIELMRNLPQERLSVAVSAVAAAQSVLDWTVRYCREREAFGRPIGSFQHNRFTLAELRTEIDVAQVFIDRLTELHVAELLSPEDAAKAKWWTTELQLRVVNSCLQLHGGYGYMLEYPVARAYLDARIQTIYGGTTEIMKEIIGRSMGFGDPPP